MNNLYHKVAVASVCTPLSFTLGANKEAKAATITVPPTIQFGVNIRNNPFGSPFSPELSSESDRVGYAPVPSGGSQTRLAEFNISSFFIARNIIIKSAVFQDKFSSVIWNYFNHPISLSIFGYIGNGTAEISEIKMA